MQPRRLPVLAVAGLPCLPVAVEGNTEARFRITCEHGQLDARLVVGDRAPFMIQGLLLRPAD